jgi:acyl-CoA reductase-like NAD-dependent aldehyde dehydrogenase
MNEAVETLRFYASLCGKSDGRVIDTGDEHNHHSYTIHEPIGVCGLITPWNYSINVLVRKLGPALAMGNTCVIKLSETTPLSGLRFASLIQEAGFPAGVVNVLVGVGEIVGEHLVKHPMVQQISFTGCTATGKHIISLASGTVKRVTCELGSKSAAIVCEDADFLKSVKTICKGMFFNSGQSPIALSRVYVHETIYDEWLKKAVEYCRNQKMGDPFDSTTTMGPIASTSQFTKVK